MTIEVFRRWSPHEAIPSRVRIAMIQDENDGLVVTVAHVGKGDPVARLVFRDFVAYRNVNESFRLRTWREQNMKDSTSLLIVDESSWVAWLREESSGVLDEFSVVHYAIYTDDDCVDVATRIAPVVERL